MTAAPSRAEDLTRHQPLSSPRRVVPFTAGEGLGLSAAGQSLISTSHLIQVPRQQGQQASSSAAAAAAVAAMRGSSEAATSAPGESLLRSTWKPGSAATSAPREDPNQPALSSASTSPEITPRASQGGATSAAFAAQPPSAAGLASQHAAWLEQMRKVQEDLSAHLKLSDPAAAARATVAAAAAVAAVREQALQASSGSGSLASAAAAAAAPRSTSPLTMLDRRLGAAAQRSGDDRPVPSVPSTPPRLPGSTTTAAPAPPRSPSATSRGSQGGGAVHPSVSGRIRPALEVQPAATGRRPSSAVGGGVAGRAGEPRPLGKSSQGPCLGKPS